jgi:uncharacterized protein YjiS (DUF1127 family)
MAGRFFENPMGEPAMPSTTDGLINLKALRPPDDLTRAQRLVSRPRDLLGSSRSSVPATNVYPFVNATRNDRLGDRETARVVRIWWERWRERRRFARALPWLADEVLEDYGLTREQVRRLCRRPFWRA